MSRPMPAMHRAQTHKNFFTGTTVHLNLQQILACLGPCLPSTITQTHEGKHVWDSWVPAPYAHLAQ
eukprot:scaffold55914_cov15-Tisochrysis_lutea.AAC.1